MLEMGQSLVPAQAEKKKKKFFFPPPPPPSLPNKSHAHILVISKYFALKIIDAVVLFFLKCLYDNKQVLGQCHCFTTYFYLTQ